MPGAATGFCFLTKHIDDSFQLNIKRRFDKYQKQFTFSLKAKICSFKSQMLNLKQLSSVALLVVSLARSFVYEQNNGDTESHSLRQRYSRFLARYTQRDNLDLIDLITVRYLEFKGIRVILIFKNLSLSLLFVKLFCYKSV